MERYLLFGYDRYYPSGGRNDFIASFDNMEAIDKYVYEQDWGYDYYDVLDRDEGVWLDYDQYDIDIYE